jgi:subtilase family serine protease
MGIIGPIGHRSAISHVVHGVFGALLVGAMVTVAAPGLASAQVTRSAAVNAVAVPTEYAITKPACSQQPVVGSANCFAIRRVTVAKGTPGAEAFVPGGGASSVGPAGGYTPTDLSTAYSVNSSGSATGQTIALVDAYNDPNINADLQTFDTNYGLPTCSETNGCLTVVSQTGSTTSLPPDDTTGWSAEETLDVQTAHSICEECKILLVETNSNSDSDLATGVDEAVTLGATEVSNSYGGAEVGSTSTVEAAYNHPGVVITASAGDDGYDSFACDCDYSQINTPAAYNTVTAVGGTHLLLNSDDTRSSETVWNDDAFLGGPDGASGGGCSAIFSAPSWQTSLSVWSQTECGTFRLDNDISADASPYTGFDIYDSYNCDGDCTPPDWATYGGTSLSSPIIAAIYALAGGAHGVAVPASTLYAHLGTSALYDVTSGGNGYCDGESASECGDPNTSGNTLDCDYPAYPATTPNPGTLACDAAEGYDGPSGVGTPNGTGAFVPVSTTVSTTVLVPSNGATVSGSTILDASATNATSVEFVLFGGSYGYSGKVLCTATLTYYGWVCSWNTATVPNGSYTLVSDASNASSSAGSAGVSITVSNSPPPTTSVLIPSNGATVSGSTTLDASATNATSVEFVLFGGSYGYSGKVLCTATLTYYGWVCSWNTATVPNHSYTLVSDASNASSSAGSAGVSITVNNSPPNCSDFGPNANLQGCNLTDADLAGLNLTGANLFNADLTSANLSDAILTDANLSDANLDDANLTGVISGGIIGTPSALPPGWSLVGGYLVGP